MRVKLADANTPRDYEFTARLRTTRRRSSGGSSSSARP